MDIVIFKELTNSEYISELKAEAEKYNGLYVDMNEPEQRKYVKDKADLINGLLKKIDRKRIDATKEYKKAVEKEAASIMKDLKVANLPFTLLIDEYKIERKKILDAEKARKQSILDAEQYELDHEQAILENKVWDLEADKREADKLKAIAEQEALIKQREVQAAKQARLDEVARQDLAAKKAKEEAEIREANKQHASKIHRIILKALLDSGISEKDAKTVITLAAKRELPNVIISY